MPSSVPRAPWRPIAAAVLTLAVAAAPAFAFNGHGRYVDTVYGTTSWVVPTAYVAPSAYYLPTVYSSYFYPTVYASSVLSPTYYVEPTTYLVGTSYGTRLRRSAWRPIYGTTRSYYYDLTPTSYWTTSYWPTTTTMDLPVVVSPTIAYAGDCVTAAPAVVGRSAPSGAATGGGTTTKPPANVNSEPATGSGGTGTGATEPPFDDLGGVQTPIPDVNGGTGGAAPTSPPEAGGAGSVQAPGQIDRSSFRPAPTDMRARALPSLGALRGEVITGADNTPVPNIRVVLQDVRQTYGDKEETSDLAGRFEVVLPNGDWRVNVEDKDGKLAPYGTITVAGGRFYDERGRVVSSLRLHR